MELSNIFTMIIETILMTFISTLLAYIIGLPIGVLLNVTSKRGLKPNKVVNFILGTFVNILRSIPCLIVIVICIPWVRAWFGIGTGEWFTILIPMTVCAFGFVARMIEQSLNEVPAGEIEAVKSLGASDQQIIFKVLLPEAKISIITGIAVVLVSVIGYTSFAYNIAGGGLISGIYSYYKNHTGDYYTSAHFWILIVLVILLVQIIQEGTLLLTKKLDKRRKLK